MAAADAVHSNDTLTKFISGLNAASRHADSIMGVRSRYQHVRRIATVLQVRVDWLGFLLSARRMFR